MFKKMIIKNWTKFINITYNLVGNIATNEKMILIENPNLLIYLNNNIKIKN